MTTTHQLIRTPDAMRHMTPGHYSTHTLGEYPEQIMECHAGQRADLLLMDDEREYADAGMDDIHGLRAEVQIVEYTEDGDCLLIDSAETTM
jgi:hypothetical protein